MTLTILLLLATALGGYAIYSRRTAAYMPPAPAKLRTDLLYGYYGRDDAQCAATAGHVNLVFELQWDGIEPTIARMRQQPLRTVLGVSSECWADTKTPRSPEQAEARLRQTLDRLRADGVISQVVGFYPIDEPDLGGASDTDVQAVCALIRRVAGDYRDLGGSILACCYSKSGRYPGASSFDWLAVDDYPEGSNAMIGAPMAGLRAALRKDQRLFLVPGGCDPFRNNPEAFRRVAHADPKVVAVVPFIWRDYNDPDNKPQRGIGSNGMASTYAALGRELTAPRGE